MTTPHDKHTNPPAHSADNPPLTHGSGQFGELGQGGPGSDLTRQMDSTGPQTDNSGAVEFIPWDAAGKIDDEVERRTWPPGQGPNAPAGTPPAPSGDVHTGAVKGGTHQGQEDTGPGRYGGPTGHTMAAQRYAGASDNAPTDPVAGAVTTLAAETAADHTMRPAGPGGQHQTWEGGTAGDQAMQAAQTFEHTGGQPTPAADTHPSGGGSSSRHSGTAGSSGQHTGPSSTGHNTPQSSGHGETHK